MKNLSIVREGDDVVIRFKANQQAAAAAEPSSTGKTKLLATTSGAAPFDCDLAGLKIALNVTIPNK